MKRFFALFFALIIVGGALFFVANNNAFMTLVIAPNETHQFEIINEEAATFNTAYSKDLKVVSVTIDSASQPSQVLKTTHTTYYKTFYNSNTSAYEFSANTKTVTSLDGVITEQEATYYYDGTTLYTMTVADQTTKTKQTLSLTDALYEIPNSASFEATTYNKYSFEEYKLDSSFYFSASPLVLGQKISYTPTYTQATDSSTTTYVFDTFRNLKAVESTGNLLGVEYNVDLTINSINEVLTLTVPDGLHSYSTV